jgi:hypothetical protein
MALPLLLPQTRAPSSILAKLHQLLQLEKQRQPIKLRKNARLPRWKLLLLLFLTSYSPATLSTLSALSSKTTLRLSTSTSSNNFVPPVSTQSGEERAIGIERD